MAASSTPSRKKSLTWLVPASLGAGALALSLVTGSLGAFTASITNNNNTVGAGALTMQEQYTDGSGTPCVTSGDENKVTCSSINKYGGKTAQEPGKSSTVAITLSSIGSVHPASGKLMPEACEAKTTPNMGTGNLCQNVTVKIVEIAGTDTKTLWDDTAQALAAQKSAGGIPLAFSKDVKSVKYEITTTVRTGQAIVPAGASDNSLNGTSLSQALNWTFTA